MNSNQAALGERKITGRLLPVCGICDQVPHLGIRGGYPIRGSFMCDTCERSIVELEVGSPRYQEILTRIKMILNL